MPLNTSYCSYAGGCQSFSTAIQWTRNQWFVFDLHVFRLGRSDLAFLRHLVLYLSSVIQMSPTSNKFIWLPEFVLFGRHEHWV
jgi:hypothetical protein